MQQRGLPKSNMLTKCFLIHMKERGTTAIGMLSLEEVMHFNCPLFQDDPQSKEAEYDFDLMAYFGASAYDDFSDSFRVKALFKKSD